MSSKLATPGQIEFTKEKMRIFQAEPDDIVRLWRALPAEEKAKYEEAARKKYGSTNARGGGKRKRRRTEKYSSYIFKVLKQVHPDTGISRRGMAVMNDFLHDIFERIAGEAGRLARYSKKATLSSREIQTSVRLVLPGELAKHAVSEATKAVTKYNASRSS